jgi:hypothetical protein
MLQVIYFLLLLKFGNFYLVVASCRQMVRFMQIGLVQKKNENRSSKCPCSNHSCLFFLSRL